MINEIDQQSNYQDHKSTFELLQAKMQGDKRKMPNIGIGVALNPDRLRSKESIEAGIAWARQNSYIFGGGFGYDMRVNDNITEQARIAAFAYDQGRTWGGAKYLDGKGRALITGDHRVTSDSNRMALIQGLLDEGIDVDTQMDGQGITTGLTNRKGQADGYDLVIQITGSHNPWDGNGFKVLGYRGDPFFGKSLIQFSQDIEERQGWSEEIHEGRLTKLDNLVAEHVEALAKVLPDLKNQPPMIADFRGGVAGSVTIALAEKKGYRVVKLNSAEDSLDEVLNLDDPRPVFIAINYEPSPMMVNGIWDPSKREAFDNIKRLQKRIAEDPRSQGHPAFAGAVYDGDGDRSGFIDENGGLVMPERMLNAFLIN